MPDRGKHCGESRVTGGQISPGCVSIPLRSFTRSAMLSAMSQRPLFWLLCLSLWLALLLWRLVDFFDEENNRNYHMTRVGLNIQGGHAETLQLALIALCGLLSGYCLWRLWRVVKRAP